LSDADAFNLSPEDEVARLKRKEWLDFLLARIKGLEIELDALIKKIGEQTDRMEGELEIETKLKMISDALDDEERLSATFDELQLARHELDGALLHDGPIE